MIRLRCTIELGGDRFLSREITFPCFPYPGLIVGALGPVVRVLVCQGDLDGTGDTVVEFLHNPESDLAILSSQNWKHM